MSSITDCAYCGARCWSIPSPSPSPSLSPHPHPPLHPVHCTLSTLHPSFPLFSSSRRSWLGDIIDSVFAPHFTPPTTATAITADSANDTNQDDEYKEPDADDDLLYDHDGGGDG